MCEPDNEYLKCSDGDVRWIKYFVVDNVEERTMKVVVVVDEDDDNGGVDESCKTIKEKRNVFDK